MSVLGAENLSWVVEATTYCSVTDPAGNITHVNEKFCELTKYNRNELLGHNHRILNSGLHSKEFFGNLWNTITSGKVWMGEVRNRAKDGTYRWMMTVIIPYLDKTGQPRHYVVLRSDITDRKMREEAHNQEIRNNEEKFRALVDASAQIVWTTDSEGRAVEDCPSWREFTGQTYHQWKDYGYYDAFHPEDKERVRLAWEEAIKSKTPTNINFRLQHRTGEWRWVCARAVPLLNDRGEVLGWVGMNQDITNQIRADQELQRALQSAEKASQVKSQFLANMSHEIRSPMNSIIGYADLLSLPELSSSQRLTYANRIRSSGEHLLNLIDDILDLSKVEAGKLIVTNEVFSVTDLITDCVQSLSVLTNSKSIAIQVEFRTPVPERLDSDRRLIKQILMNLLSNSIKFTDNGSVRLGLEFSEISQTLSIAVEDTGMGISEDHHERIFQAFSQADSSITRKFGGTGLGLSLSKQLAQSLKGDLILDWSQVGKGSRFIFSLPVCGQLDTKRIHSLMEAKSEFPALSEAEKDILKGIKVLVAEDSVHIQTLMKIYLDMYSAEYDFVSTGTQALFQALNGDYNVVLMDIQMPDMDGLEATRQLRAKGYKCPIIALTAHAMKEEIQKSIDAGCDSHLSKPVNRKELAQTILRLARSDY